MQSGGRNMPNSMAITKGYPASARHHREHILLRSNAKIVGYYSIDVDRTYLPNSSKMLYFNPPEEDIVTWDLDAGREIAVLRGESCQKEGLGSLLQWIIENQETIRAHPGAGRLLEPNFVCTRGLLMRFMTAPYTLHERWRILAAKWKGTIYLVVDKSVKRFETGNDEKFGSWGKKFEQYVLSDAPDIAPNTDIPVKETEEFRCVYQHRFFEHSVLFSSIAKGVVSKEVLKDPLNLQQLKFVDLRTNKIIEHAGHERSLRRYKALSWWAMGYITNVDEVLCGFRDDSGVVSKLIRYNSKQLMGMGKNYWNPEECIQCCKTFLSKLAETVINECDETIYEFVKVTFDNFDITELVPSEENAVLSHAFMDAIRPDNQ